MIRTMGCVVVLVVGAAAQIPSVTLRVPKEAVAFGRSYSVEVVVRHASDHEIITPSPSDFSPLLVDDVVRTSTLKDAGIVADTIVANARAESSGNVTLGRFIVRLKDRSGVITSVSSDPVSIAVASALRDRDGFELDPIAPWVRETSYAASLLLVASVVTCGGIVWRLRRKRDAMSLALARLHTQLGEQSLTIGEAWPIMIAASSRILMRDASTLTASEWAGELSTQIGSGYADLAHRVAVSRDAVVFGSQVPSDSLVEDVQRLIEVMRERLEQGR